LRENAPASIGAISSGNHANSVRARGQLVNPAGYRFAVAPRARASEDDPDLEHEDSPLVSHPLVLFDAGAGLAFCYTFFKAVAHKP
jgi:hypothetical protein